ncbi:MAG: nucleotidyl transferase AbiEii/AbiGii toxin family protein [Candidatus Omnitrophica bacterium]|nr:nucleotidyl transferase AbiEii/AbiGii toxin family protein [Candidatus Omnitrophota bacterium]
MNFEAVIKMVLERFREQKVRCILIGGFALHASGYSRATNDIDFLVHGQDVFKVKQILGNLGYDIVHESKDVLNFIGQLKELGGIDFILAHRKYALSMLERARPFEILQGCMVNVAVPEDIIGLKLQAMANDPQRKAQDMADIQWLIHTHYKSLDVLLLREYFSLFDRVDDLEKILEEVKNA